MLRVKTPRFHVRPGRHVDTLAPMPSSIQTGKFFNKPGKGHNRAGFWRRLMRAIVRFF